MTTTDDTPSNSELQEEMDRYLESIGLDQVEAKWPELEATIVPHIPHFLAAGGTYYRRPHNNVWYTVPAMIVSYGDKWLELMKGVWEDGYTVIRVRLPISIHMGLCSSKSFDGIRVDPRHLDAAICRLLDIPYPEGPPLPKKPHWSQIPPELIPRFLAAGGKNDYSGTSYGEKRVWVEDYHLLGCHPSVRLKLLVPSAVKNEYEVYAVVAPEDLDAALCEYLEIPEA